MAYPDTIAELRALISDLQSRVASLEGRVAMHEGPVTRSRATHLTVLSPLVGGGVRGFAAAPDQLERAAGEELQIEKAEKIPAEQDVASRRNVGNCGNVTDRAATPVASRQNDVATEGVNLSRHATNNSLGESLGEGEPQSPDQIRVHNDMRCAGVDHGPGGRSGDGAEIALPTRQIVADDDIDNR